MGLSLLEAAVGPDEAAAVRAAWPAACAAHVRPEPLVAEGMVAARLAARDPDRFSLMDVSDGLARDIPRLLGGHGAVLELPSDFLPDEVRRYADERGLDAASFACLRPGAWAWSRVGRLSSTVAAGRAGALITLPEIQAQSKVSNKGLSYSMDNIVCFFIFL